MFLVDEFEMNVSEVSEFIAWESVPVIIGSLWVVGYLLARFPAWKVTVWSGVLTAISLVVFVLPASPHYLWVTLFLVGLPLSICLTACATMLSIAASPEEQGRVMGNNQALVVFGEATSAILGGSIAALAIKASIPAMGVFMLIGVGIVLIGRARSQN
jgi:predicted MFS family arabinose efflux permease